MTFHKSYRWSGTYVVPGHLQQASRICMIIAYNLAPMSYQCICNQHYIDVIMTTMESQITSLTSVYSTVYSDADQRKHPNSASLAFVRGIHRDRWIPRTKGPQRGKCFHLMTSSCSIWSLHDSHIWPGTYVLPGHLQPWFGPWPISTGNSVLHVCIHMVDEVGTWG